MTPLASYLPSAAYRSSGAGANPALPEATPAQRAKIQTTAQAFEASFLSNMFGQMFEGTEIEAPFGGGQGEAAFRSFMTDAMGKSMARHGGIGLARPVAAEMLKLQGLR